MAFTVVVSNTVVTKSLRSIGIKYEEAYARYSEFQRFEATPQEVRDYGVEWDYYERVKI